MNFFRAVTLVFCTAMMTAALMAQRPPTSRGIVATPRAPVNLGSAGNYVILSETGITDVPPSPITGNIGSSPISGSAIGVSCAEVTGTISAVDAAGPAPCSLIAPIPLSQAVLDMQTAYTDAAGRTAPDFTELGAGNISGMTLGPGLYKWSTGVMIDNTGVTLSGGPNAVWIFQISGDVLLANNGHVMLAGGARANNVFWQVGGPTAVTIGTTGVFAGNILSAKQIIFGTGASLTGRAFAFTQVTLQSTSITSPGILVDGVPVVIPPTVTSTVPPNLATAVPIGNGLTATFSEAMNSATITPLTFTLQSGITPVVGVVSYAGVTAVFTPQVNLAPSTTYTATITTGAQDPAGVGLAANYVWTFTTGAIADTTPPTVVSTVPSNGATNIPIGTAVFATFSEPMNPLTITTATFKLSQGSTPVSGTVNYAGLTATFTPLTALTAGTLYTGTITTGATDLAANPLAANYVWTFTTGATADTTPPTVISTVPSNGATNVAIGTAVFATFSEPMNPLTITTATFTLSQGSTPVSGTVTYAGLTAGFTPLTALTTATLYTATITTGATDLAGNPLAANYVWSFTTSSSPVIVTGGPTVTSTIPSNGASGVPITSAPTATFSEPMNPLTITSSTFTLKQGNTPIVGTVSYSGVTATFTPQNALAPAALFTATITTGAMDLTGNALASNYVWSFDTGTSTTTPLMVTSTLPANNATSVTLSTNVVANFNKVMNPSTINTATFLLEQGTTLIPGTVIYAGTAVTFRPSSNLAPNTVYTAVITSVASDLGGQTLGANYVWTFTTGAGANLSPVCLANFAVLSGSSILNAGPTAITGDIGVNPGMSVTGFPPGTLSGMIHAGDTVALEGITNLSAAYGDAVSLSLGAVPISGDLGGQTLTAGLYQSLSSLEISSGDFTLDAKGDPTAVFIFQIASTFTTAAGRHVLLAGGAKALNIFWQVGGAATLGANSTLQGSILAAQSITLNTGATVDGRLLAQDGPVMLASNIVTSPPPAIAAGQVLNAASDGRMVAAGSIASVFGNSLGSALVAASGYPLPQILGGTSLQVGGIGAPLYMTSCSQANMQIPWETVTETQVPVTATVGGLVSAQQPVAVAQFAPGIFSLNQTGSGQAAVEIVPTAQLAAPLGPAGRPVQRGEYIAIFCTGLGPVSNQPASGTAASSSPLSSTLTLPTVLIGTVAAQVTYSGLAPGFAGLYQVNALVPDGVLSGNNIDLVLSIGGVQSNTVTIAVQ